MLSTMQKRTIYLSAFLIFIFSCSLRFSYVNTAVVDTPFRADAGKYVTLAANLALQHSYSVSQEAPFLPSTYITPGYPLFLTIWIYSTESLQMFYAWLLNFQALLGVCCAMLVFLLGLELSGLAVALVAGLLFAISPHHVIANGYVLTESLFTFLLLLSTFLCLQATRRNLLALFLITGAVIGFAALVRPILLLLPLLLLPILWKSMGKQAWPRFLIICVGVTLIWAPWIAWKDSQPATGETSLAVASLTLGSYPDLIYKTPELRGFPYREDRSFDGKNLTESAEIIWNRVANEPARYVQWYLLGKPLTYWGSSIIAGAGGPFIYPVTTSIYNRNPVAAASLHFMMLTHAFWVLIAALTSCWGLTRLIRAPSGTNTFFVLYISSILLAYFTVIHSILAPLPRYAYPVYPFAYLLAAFGLQIAGGQTRIMWQRTRKKEAHELS
jgi:4-amino-4-deoxy-L-arabinose transferase-like glycosyltransferase